jgi:uncharacterized protein (TIGR02757 family)
MERARGQTTVLSAARVAALRPALDALLSNRDDALRLAADPLQAPHRYRDPADQEIAALFAAQLAYGRVSAFMPIIDRILALADAAGGPRAWIEGFSEADSAALAPLVYRWNRGPDFALMARTLQQVIATRGSLGAVFVERVRRSHSDVGLGLTAGIAELRAAAEVAAGAPFASLPRGFKTMLSSPSGGSACKRWNMLLRWMARDEGPDLGLWSIPTSKLILPLDTHTLQLSQLLGLTRRRDGSWRTAAEITRNLRRIDPDDPVRYDFALAHLGISGGCQKARVAEICDPCPMVGVCRVGGRREESP